ncbi:hypothetical protein [Ectobacillus ponti]|uniref:Uncharacterized protein n=1 Tax=Ectobacillus ponti TaxID=2961894 RepID=A0AA42BST2_9BACI|nr:hypothetical protein [Ectobacillus ponti]MCP8970869.1 hypothetical protein [Ectobacillus ponti]
MNEAIKQYGYYVQLIQPRPRQVIMMLRLRSFIAGIAWGEPQQKELRNYDRLLLHNARQLQQGLSCSLSKAYPATHWWWQLGQLADCSLYVDLSAPTAS